MIVDAHSVKKVATIQARMNSARLPGKVLMSLANQPALERMCERVRRAKFVDEIVIATTISREDDVIVEWARANNISVFRGSEEDVLERVLGAARKFNADIIIQLTGDCPLIDPLIIDQLVEMYVSTDTDYVSNIMRRSYPRGLDTQVFSTKA
ncbi:MAG: spore coat polysaccharide biosynthesis protein SpsF, partial [Candidatus Omnitrophota bacterium]